jgi:hypothetical protein
VIALLALVVALGGTGYAALAVPANSVGTRQLTRDSVGTRQLKNHAVTPLKIAPGAGVDLVYTRAATNVTVAANSIGGGDATCPKGTYPVGGGAGTDNVPGVTVTEMLPFSSASDAYSGAADSWEVYVQNTTGQPQQMEVYAVCVVAASATATY